MSVVSTSQPLVSVIIPTYNRAGTVLRAIDSALRQTYPNKQIIVIDDGSKDNTRELLEKRTDIEYHWQQNQRQSAARNHGLDKARGEYVATLDSDDFWDENHLERAITAIQRYQVPVYFANWREINEDGKLTCPDRFKETSYMPPVSTAPDADGFCHLSPDRARELIVIHRPAPSTAMVLRRDLMVRWNLEVARWTLEDLLLLSEITLNNNAACAFSSRPTWTKPLQGDNISVHASVIAASRREACGLECIYRYIHTRLPEPEHKRYRRLVAEHFFDYAYHTSVESALTAVPLFFKSWQFQPSPKPIMAMGKGLFRAALKKLRNFAQIADQNFAKITHRLKPGLYRHLRWPLQKPYQRAELKIVSPGGGIGDELLASGVIKAVKEANPSCQITFVSRYPEFWRGHPLIHTVLPSTDANKRGGLDLSYRYLVPSRESVFRLIGERVGLPIDQFRPVPPTVTPSPWLAAELSEIKRPYLLIQPETSSWTPNKAWPLERWESVARELSKNWLVIEVGTKSLLHLPCSENFKSLAGQTSLSDLACLISRAKLYLGAESGGMHIAAGYDTPAVIVFGGYTAPENFPYPHNIPIGSDVSCAPCWLYTPCPYSLKCLHGINAEQVIAAAQNFLKK